MTHEEYVKAIAPFEDFKSRAGKCNDNAFKSKLMRAYAKGLYDIGQKILIENNITPHKLINYKHSSMMFEPISARINKNNEVILIGYLYQDDINYKVEKECKLNDLEDIKKI